MTRLENMVEAVKTTARNVGKQYKTVLGVGLVSAAMLYASGCARTSGGKLTLGALEWGDKTAITKSEAIQKQVIESDAKYSDTVDVTPGKMGISYK